MMKRFKRGVCLLVLVLPWFSVFASDTAQIAAMQGRGSDWQAITHLLYLADTPYIEAGSTVSIKGIWNHKIHRVELDWTGQESEATDFPLPTTIQIPLKAFGYDALLDQNGVIYTIDMNLNTLDSLISLPELDDIFFFQGPHSSLSVGLTREDRSGNRRLLDLQDETPTVLYDAPVLSHTLFPQSLFDEASVQLALSNKILLVSSSDPQTVLEYTQPGYYLNKSLVEAFFLNPPISNQPTFLRLFHVLDDDSREITLETDTGTEPYFSQLYASAAEDSVHGLTPLLQDPDPTDASHVAFAFLVSNEQGTMLHWFQGTMHDSLPISGDVNKLRFLQASRELMNPDPLSAWREVVSFNYLIWDEYDATVDSTFLRYTITGKDTSFTMGIPKFKPGFPKQYFLDAPWPNPFNGSVTFGIRLSQSVFIKLSVWDVLGREVARLEEGVLAAGAHTLEWQPESSVASGTYIVTLEVKGQRMVRRIFLVK